MPNTIEEVKEYTARRGLAKGSITRLVKFADGITERTSLADISTRLELLERAFNELNVCEAHLTKHDLESELPDYETKYLNVKAKLRERLAASKQADEIGNMEQLMSRILRDQNDFLINLSSNFTSSLNQTISQTSDGPHAHARLPKLNVPTFTGEYKDFPSFRDLYVASVHCKLGLNDVEKFQYLKGYLRGEASDLIKHISVSEANYLPAWQKLCERYDKKKHVMTDFIKSFINQPTVKHGSVTELRHLYNRSDEVIRGIGALGEEASKRDQWLIFLLLQKTDHDTSQAWALRTVGTAFPTIEEFLKFINERCDALETCEPIKPHSSKSPLVKTHQIRVEQSMKANECCVYCKGSHRIYTCEAFTTLSTTQRRNQASSLRLCFNCLSPTHMATQCYSKRSCSTCNRRHHTLLHEGIQSNSSMLPGDNDSTVPPLDTNNSGSSNEPNNIINANISGISTALLPTARVRVINQYGQHLQCNLLLDSGSQISFISERCFNRLGIARMDGKVRVEGLATSNVSTTGRAAIMICSRFNDLNVLNVRAYILPRITSVSPNIEISTTNREFMNLPLADPNFNRRKQIDILLGADYFFHVLGRTQHVFRNYVAQETTFGYVISRTPSDATDVEGVLVPYKNFNACVSETNSLERWLRKFWEQEEVFQDIPLSPEDQFCEQHFVSTYRKLNGRFVVELPINHSSPILGESYNTALKRLLAMERKRSRNPEFNERYTLFMREYERLGHMRKLMSDQIEFKEGEVFYLPHHGVLREDSVTTKLRVVFDGSAASSNGTSLNDRLMIGTPIQDTLWSILLRFRTFKVAICGDIEKMYRQILVDPKQTAMQRILWRESSADPITHYELLTVTYGTASAPFLAIRVLHQIASDCEKQFPEVAKVIQNNFYVDDVLTGADNELQAAQIKDELMQVLGEAGFVLRKWRANRPSLSDGTNETPIVEDGQPSKVLGLHWNAQHDIFLFQARDVCEARLSKRSVLSIAAQIFDPLGWLSPFTIKTKIFLQSLWLQKISWDEPLSAELHTSWQQLQDQFKQLNNIQVPRFVSNLTDEFQIHGFSDASELAYSAAVYVRTRVKDKINVILLTAKTKVSPIKQVSLPRLELCGAYLLTKLVKAILSAYHIEPASVWVWIDSTVVLSWLSGHPRKWKTYVANRVSAIHQLLPNAIWRHIKGSENPADLATRGILAKQLVENKLWWNGPDWLSTPEQNWPSKPTLTETMQEQRINAVSSLHATVEPSDVHPVSELYCRISTWGRLARTMAYVQRVVHNLKSKSKLTGRIRVSEVDDAELTIIKYIQESELSKDMTMLKQSNELPSNSRLASLAPFVDARGMLRVGGRLEHSNCSYDMKHPLILPKGHVVTQMIAVYLHLKFLHPGPSLLLGLSRHKYWILGGRNLCRAVCRKCVICFRHSKLKSTQQMGCLPQARITPCRPFSIIGVDYAGPILLASKKGRGAKLTKGFVVVFVCFATKALHIEVASELTTDAFLAALDRFVARRGAPTEIHSDNGTNFVGAKRQLHEHYQLLSSPECQNQLQTFALANRIKWSFIPPISPHFGGIWESAVRSVKTHLIKVTGSAHLTFEEMSTVMAQIEGILNSRPLCAIRNEDVCNINALTPSHFLTLGPITALPHANYDDIKIQRLSRWERVQKIVQQFWKVYSLMYLHTLQQRSKWPQKQNNLEINDLVLVHESKSPPCSWPLGRIIEVHSGRDGLTRVATVKFNSSVLKRPIHKLYKLPLDDEN